MSGPDKSRSPRIVRRQRSERERRVVVVGLAACRALDDAQVLPGPGPRSGAGADRYARGAGPFSRQARQLRRADVALRLPAHPRRDALPGTVRRRPVRRVDQHREVARLAGLPVGPCGLCGQPHRAAGSARAAAGRPDDGRAGRRRSRAGRDAGRGGRRVRCARAARARPGGAHRLAGRSARTRPPSRKAPPGWCAGRRSWTNSRNSTRRSCATRCASAGRRCVGELARHLDCRRPCSARCRTGPPNQSLNRPPSQ